MNPKNSHQNNHLQDKHKELKSSQRLTTKSHSSKKIQDFLDINAIVSNSEARKIRNEDDGYKTS